MRKNRLLLVGLIGLSIAVMNAPTRQAAAATGGDIFVAVGSCRLVDTRESTSQWLSSTTLRVQVVSPTCGIPSGATAAAMTITATQTTATGFVSAFPSGIIRPEVSVLNFEGGQTRANGAIIQVSATGAVDIFASAATQIIVDVTGYFRPSSAGQSASGRFITVPPTRLLDSRNTAIVAANSTTVVPMPSFVPQDAIALALNVTVTDTAGWGYITAYQPGTGVPDTSVLNFDRARQTRAAGLVATANSNGVALYSSASTHLIVDITGYFTGTSAPVNDDGLFIPINPRRLLDTRVSGQRRAGGGTLDLDVSASAQIPISAVASNWTLTDTAGGGFVTAFASGTSLPPTSTVNSDSPGQTVANLGLIRVSDRSIASFSSSDTHLLVDAFGWFTQTRKNSPVVAAVGDMACRPSSSTTILSCRQMAVSDRMLTEASLAALLALGDLQYDDGELVNFQTSYEQSFGRLKAITKPVPGNHEYHTPGASGYYTYFGSAAGDPAKGYYSFDIGTDWHVVGLNSNCSDVSCKVGSAQEQWLRADLAQSTRRCVIGMWHHPRFSSGAPHGGNNAVRPLWQALEDFGADMVLSGHEHDYERFAPQRNDTTASASGVREFVVGTGGRAGSLFGDPQPNSEFRLALTFGYLRLTLSPGFYSWQFITEGGTVADSGEELCR